MNMSSKLWTPGDDLVSLTTSDGGQTVGVTYDSGWKLVNRERMRGTLVPTHTSDIEGGLWGALDTLWDLQNSGQYHRGENRLLWNRACTRYKSCPRYACATYVRDGLVTSALCFECSRLYTLDGFTIYQPLPSRMFRVGERVLVEGGFGVSKIIHAPNTSHLAPSWFRYVVRTGIRLHEVPQHKLRRKS